MASNSKSGNHKPMKLNDEKQLNIEMHDISSMKKQQPNTNNTSSAINLED